MSNSTHPIIQQLRAERISQGITILAFADQLGYDQKTLMRLEHGLRGGKFKFICDYADALGYEIQLCEKEK